MIILDEKMTFPPPPPYVTAGPASPPPFPHQMARSSATLVTVPPHILLRIVYETFTHNASIQKQRKTLYWLTMSLRLVNRAMYIACMHVLRSTYLPAYTALVRPPYSSDPFPLAAPTTSSPLPQDPPISPILSLQRETRVLDLFLALKVREDVWADESELHLERDESFRDLFDLMQPRSRLEDLVRAYGVRAGIITISGPDPVVKRRPSTTALGGSGSSTPKSTAKGGSPDGFLPLSFSALTASFSSRKVGVVLTTRERKRTIVEVERTRDEPLEVAATKLVKELKAWLVASSRHSSRGAGG